MRRFGKSVNDSGKGPLVSTKARITMSMSEYLRKYSIIAAIGFALIIMQTSCFGVAPPLGATPDLIFAFVLAVAFLDGIGPGCVAAVASGFFSDVFGCEGASALILFYFACALAVALLVEGRLAKNWASFMICVFSACTLKALYYVLTVSMASLDYSIIDLFGNTIIPEFAVTVIASVPIYFTVKKVTSGF